MHCRVAAATEMCGCGSQPSGLHRRERAPPARLTSGPHDSCAKREELHVNGPASRPIHMDSTWRCANHVAAEPLDLDGTSASCPGEMTPDPEVSGYRELL